MPPEQPLNTPPEKASAKVQNRRVHMANERTFLAWVRTSIGIMAFGFVVERFGLFMKQLTYLIGKTPVQAMGGTAGREYSSILGVVLVALGALMGVLAFVRFKRVERQIDENTYRPSLILDILLTISVLSIGVFLIMYLIHRM